MISEGDERVVIDGSIIVLNLAELVDVVELEFVVTEPRFLIIDCGDEITDVDLGLTCTFDGVVRGRGWWWRRGGHCGPTAQ